MFFSRYVIEKKEKLGSRWVKVGKTAGAECKYKATDVDEGSEVQFQVRAENEAGVGSPCEPTQFMTIEDPTSTFYQWRIVKSTNNYHPLTL